MQPCVYIHHNVQRLYTEVGTPLGTPMTQCDAVHVCVWGGVSLAKGAYDNITEELFVLHLLLCKPSALGKG